MIHGCFTGSIRRCSRQLHARDEAANVDYATARRHEGHDFLDHVHRAHVVECKVILDLAWIHIEQFCRAGDCWAAGVIHYIYQCIYFVIP